MPEHRLKFSPQFKAEAVQMVVSNWPTYGLVLPNGSSVGDPRLPERPGASAQAPSVRRALDLVPEPD